MKSNIREVVRKAGVVAVCMSIVSVAVLSGAFGPSAVQEVRAEWSEECDFTDSLIGAAYNTITGADSGCVWESGDETQVENLTDTDAYSSGLSLKDSADSYTSTTANYMEDSRTVAYSKGKITLVNELNNETSSSVAKNEVNKSVEDYYSRSQKQVIADWNAKVMQLTYLANSSSGLRGTYYTGGNSYNYPVAEYKTNISYTLANGTTTTIYGIALSGVGRVLTPVSGSGTDSYHQGIVEIQDPDTGAWTQILDTTDYGTIGNFDGDGKDPKGSELLDTSEAQSTQVVNNLGPYSDEVYSQYQAGEIDSTDLALNDPTVIAQEASTDLDSTGYYSYAAIMLASIGAAGNVNVSHTVKTGDGTSLNGTVYYTGDDAPVDGWQTGTTYNLTNLNGTVYMAVQKESGNATVVDLSDYGSEFTITEATNTKTGDTVNTTTINRYTYDSTNASNLQEEINRLKELRETYKNVDQGGGGGGLIDSGSGTKNGLIAGLAAVLVLLAVTRD